MFSGCSKWLKLKFFEKKGKNRPAFSINEKWKKPFFPEKKGVFLDILTTFLEGSNLGTLGVTFLDLFLDHLFDRFILCFTYLGVNKGQKRLIKWSKSGQKVVKKWSKSGVIWPPFGPPISETCLVWDQEVEKKGVQKVGMKTRFLNNFNKKIHLFNKKRVTE